jgi:hypothetical protein
MNLRVVSSATLVLGLTLAAAPRSEASPELRKQLGKMAATIKKCLDEEGENVVAIGQFVGPPQLMANPGPGLALLLTRELQSLKVTVKVRDAKLYVAGEFRAVTDVGDPKAKQPAVELKMKLMDRTNRVLDQWSCGFLAPQDIAILVGANTALPPLPGKEPLKVLDRDLDNPKVFVKGTRVSNGPNRPYSVEILVAGKPRPVDKIEGLPFVHIRRDEIYKIRINNDSNHDAAVKVVIDGIDIFAFNEDPEPDGKRRDYQVMVGKGKSVVVKGWYRSKGMSDSFQVTEYSKSAAGQLLISNPNQLGTITAAFRACWQKDSDRPADEPLARDGDATGFGPRVEDQWAIVQRTVGLPRDVITVRYQKH